MNIFENAFLTKLAQALSARLLKNPAYIMRSAKKVAINPAKMNKSYNAALKAGKIPASAPARAVSTVTDRLRKVVSQPKPRTLKQMMAARH